MPVGFLHLLKNTLLQDLFEVCLSFPLSLVPLARDRQLAFPARKDRNAYSQGHFHSEKQEKEMATLWDAAVECLIYGAVSVGPQSDI